MIKKDLKKKDLTRVMLDCPGFHVANCRPRFCLQTQPKPQIAWVLDQPIRSGQV